MSPRPSFMIPSQATADFIVGIALSAARRGNDSLFASLSRIPAPIYATDRDGWVTFFNESCIDFAGRTPVVGEDRWCVTWKLFLEDGTFLPHDSCPMAIAIKEKRDVRGAVAVAQRPDGTRVLFSPYPTPLLDEEGEVSGAINILIDITDRRQAADLRAQAERCRHLSMAVRDRQAAETLRLMAEEYDAKALSLGG